MKNEDVVIGMKVVPHSKTSSRFGTHDYRNSFSWKLSNKLYLYVVGKGRDANEWMLSHTLASDCGDVYSVTDFEPYKE